MRMTPCYCFATTSIGRTGLDHFGRHLAGSSKTKRNRETQQSENSQRKPVSHSNWVGNSGRKPSPSNYLKVSWTSTRNIFSSDHRRWVLRSKTLLRRRFANIDGGH